MVTAATSSEASRHRPHLRPRRIAR
jgi:hypothetical protein